MNKSNVLPYCEVCEEHNFTCEDCGFCKECDECEGESNE